MTQPFQLNSQGRMVFPSNFAPELDFAALADVEQLEAVIRRDFETKSPSGTEILARIEQGRYTHRYELMRDVAMNLFWSNRYAITMFDKRPCRWGDVPRNRDDLYMPTLTPWEDGPRKAEAVREVYQQLPATWDQDLEDRIFEVIFDVFSHRTFHATDLSPVKPTVAELLADPDHQTLRLTGYDPDYPVYRFEDILDASEDVPELEALHRWAMVLHNQYPWDRTRSELARVGDLRDDDYVVLFHPRDRQVQQFLTRVRTGAPGPYRPSHPPVEARQPTRPYRPIAVRDLAVQPRILALSVEPGDQVCSNEDLIRNSGYNWSPMSAAEISSKTGIEQRLYTSLDIEEIALRAARSALAHAGVGPEEVGAVVVCTCTSNRLIPSIATYLSGALGIYQSHASFDLIAACAGMPYGLAEAVRLIQEVERPVLVVCVEKFSDKIGNVRPSRMIFGDGAAALLVGVAEPGEAPDIEFLKTYASGPESQVNSIIWPNPDFDNNITVYGPEVKTLAGRYLAQMLEEIGALPDPDGKAVSLLDSIDLIVPHQANKTMVIELAAQSGLSADRLYFNIERMGNTSSASIPLAIYDAVSEGVITGPTRIFAPGFGAGAVAGYAVMTVDPAVMAPRQEEPEAPEQERAAIESTVEDISQAFS
ncbi:3-oxoacyl-[acyl-carrier-protein] synthase III C-terminal domain-containing protein [Ornithinicoccus hortensis]|uniref:3-oxoacyl-(Acyl-carrier-protein) synthase III n=1 Tax=Ornithinicoccus hortensis TaxID=82346 RepID=A0A542YQS2_9MICO|nr:3-oxoacyl-[acyl-carrier-protein] synthase III C-terminal domain-containing protein [Ornithinicoccus hortensis]TQL50455.1 3-oxoacyl-(acyl-carrier-protein) synthase III [Ornithinicoccus hortensis]